MMTSCVKSDHKALVVNDRSSASSNNTVVPDSVRSPATVLSSHLLHWIIYQMLCSCTTGQVLP